MLAAERVDFHQIGDIRQILSVDNHIVVLVVVHRQLIQRSHLHVGVQVVEFIAGGLSTVSLANVGFS